MNQPRVPVGSAMSSDTPAPSAKSAPPTALRYGIALVFLLYGFAKLMGSQFTVLESELDKPMGEVSGFWLTWYYFGYSAVYGNAIALAQVAGALLLTFRRTTLLGACILFGIISNIVLVDITYGIDLGATVMAVFMWCGLLAVLLFYRERLLNVFWAAPRKAPASKARRLAAWSVRIGMVIVAAGFTYWIAHFNNRLPTPLDGVWDVVAITGEEPQQLPMRIYFERNRAHLSVFRYADSSAQHHFEVDPERRTIHVWDAWLRKGEQRFAGTYELRGDELRLTGQLAGAGEPTVFHLKRVR